MKSAIIRLLAETHVHPGVGQSMGALDLPVARERTTDFPFIPGSGVKGAFRVWAKDMAGMREANGEENAQLKELFGIGAGDTGGDENAGTVLFSDARLLLLPVRCLSDAFKWVTCPALLRRFNRDTARAGSPANLDESGPDERKYLGAGEANAWLGLEEREFQKQGDADAGLVQYLATMVGVGAGVMTRRLVILSDKDFTWFARYALPVMARNALDDNKRVKQGALWNEESLPPDTLMYVLLGERTSGAVDQLTGHIVDKPYIQMGGNETIGQGWFAMNALGADGGGE